MTRKQVNEGRFTELFRRFDKEVDGPVCAAYYLSQLALTHDYLPGAEERVAKLSKKYRLYIASNGGGVLRLYDASGNHQTLNFDVLKAAVSAASPSNTDISTTVIRTSAGVPVVLYTAGKMHQLVFSGTLIADLSAQTLLGTIPSEKRPPSQIHRQIMTENGVRVEYTIGADGSIYLDPKATASLGDAIYDSITYFST